MRLLLVPIIYRPDASRPFGHSRISRACMQIMQETLNAEAGIGIKAQVPAFNRDKLDGIINRGSSEASFDDVSWILQEPVVNFSQSVVDDAIQENAEFQSKAGLKPKIIRRTVGKCCAWCSNLAGTYSYPDVPKDVYRRHENCRCTVEYDPGSGKRQNVHTKQWTADAEADKIEARKAIQANDGVFRIDDYQRAAALNGSDQAKSDWNNAQKGGRHSGIYQDAIKKTKKQLQKSIISHTEQVKLHADKIENPEQYDVGWKDKTPQQQEGLLKKWRKDMERNAQQANVEIYTWKERF